MADAATGGAPPLPLSGKERRKALKKQKRKQKRKDSAIQRLVEVESLANDPDHQLLISLREKEEAKLSERARKEFEERERLWLEASAKRKAEEEEALRLKLLEEDSPNHEGGKTNYFEDDDCDYIDDGPAEIIWGENEIIVKKKRVKVPKGSANQSVKKEEDDRPTSNPLPPQSVAFSDFQSAPPLSAQELLDSVAQQTPNFGTEQDKAHCPFHLKTGACRFGTRCSRVHFYPDKANTLLIKNMYTGPGLAWELDEGLEHTDEEVERSYEEFYEDVHTEFLKFGEIINFKVCRNNSVHLRGNVYVHYKFIESAVLAYNTMNGRYFAGKQIKCEFVSLTRWKVAICGEYMKSRLKSCSHGAACNFIHCFRNPGGDYEWADWDNPPPKYWVKKMAFLFGPSDERDYYKHVEYEAPEHLERYSRKKSFTGKKRSFHGDRENRSTDAENLSNTCEGRHSIRARKWDHSNTRKKGWSDSDDDWERYDRSSSKTNGANQKSVSDDSDFDRHVSREKHSRKSENSDTRNHERVHKRHRSPGSGSKYVGSPRSCRERSTENSYRYSELYDGRHLDGWIGEKHGDIECNSKIVSSKGKSSGLFLNSDTGHYENHASIDRTSERAVAAIIRTENEHAFESIEAGYPERYTPLAHEHETKKSSDEHKSMNGSCSTRDSPFSHEEPARTRTMDGHDRNHKSRKRGDSSGDSLGKRKNKTHSSCKETNHKAMHRRYKSIQENGSVFGSSDSDYDDKENSSGCHREHERKTKKHKDDDDHGKLYISDPYSKESRRRKKSIDEVSDYRAMQIETEGNEELLER